MKKLIILASAIYLMCSCGPEPEDMITDYIIKNSTMHNVELTIFYTFFDKNNGDTTFSIPAKEEIKESYFSMNIDSPFGGAEDSAYIIFDNAKQIIYRRDDGQLRNILDINSYLGGEVKEYWYQYQYTITDEDYANALEIK